VGERGEESNYEIAEVTGYHHKKEKAWKSKRGRGGNGGLGGGRVEPRRGTINNSRKREGASKTRPTIRTRRRKSGIPGLYDKNKEVGNKLKVISTNAGKRGRNTGVL